MEWKEDCWGLTPALLKEAGGWKDSICRSFGAFYVPGPTCGRAAEPKFLCNPMEMEFLINLTGNRENVCVDLHYRWPRFILSSGLGKHLKELHFEGRFWLFWRHWERDLIGWVFPVLVSPLKVGGMEILFVGWGGVFPRCEQALPSQDFSCVLRDEKCKLCSDLGNGLCVITGE